MADGDALEPLLTPLVGAAALEGYEFQLDEALLQELAALDAAEGGGGAAGDDGERHEAVEDADVYKMRELIREKPKDVLQYLEEEGVVKLGEFDVQDAVALKAFVKDSMLTMGADHFEVDWETLWRERLSEFEREHDKSRLGWSTKVTLEAHVVNLRDAAAEGSRGLLHPLLKRFQAHACSATVFALPAVQAVINYKWSTWARRYLMYELACYCLWLTAFTAFTLLFQSEDWTLSLWQLLQDRTGFFCVLTSVLSLLPMAAFGYMELCTLSAYGWGWLRAWNVLDLASYLLQVTICLLHLQRRFVDESWFSVLVATQQVLLWVKLHYFAKAFNPTKNTIVDTVRIVLEDLKWFLAFLTLTMVGFGLAFYALFRQDRQFPDFANIWHAFASMFSYLLAMFDYNTFYNSSNPTAAMLLFIAFEFVMNVLMLNVFIASMTNSFSKITQDEGLRLLHSKAEIIDELEATLPKWTRSRECTPAFVHILKVHPNATYEVNLSSVWSGIGLLEENLLGAQHETHIRVQELEDRMSKLHKKLDVLIKLFISNLGPSPALMLSRQATLQQGGPATVMAGRSSSQAVGASPAWPSRGGYHAGGGGGGLGSMPSLNLGESPLAPAAAAGAAPPGAFLRHAASMLAHLPEQLAGVSGPLMGPSSLAAHHHQQQLPGLARQPGPPGGAAVLHICRAGSRHYGSEQQLGAHSGGLTADAASELRSVGSGHVGVLLAQQQGRAAAAGARGVLPPVRLARLRGVQPPAHHAGLQRAHSL